MSKSHYRTETMPLDAGWRGQTTALLNRFAQEGWELIASHVVTLIPSALAPEHRGVGLFCIFRWSLATAPPTPPLPARVADGADPDRPRLFTG